MTSVLDPGELVTEARRFLENVSGLLLKANARWENTHIFTDSSLLEVADLSPLLSFSESGDSKEFESSSCSIMVARFDKHVEW